MKLKDWRESKGWSQQEFASDISGFAKKYVSQRTISAWESGALPRKTWIKIILEYTKNKVTAADLAQ